MYAFVRFFEDDMCYALPVSSVADLSPLHGADFDNQKVYLVHRAEQDGSAGQPCEAQILALADTVEEFEDSITQKKMKIPKMSIKNSGNSIENNFGEERMPLRHKKALSQDHGRPLSNSSKSLAAVVARLERNAASSCMEGEEDLDEDRLAEEGEDADDEDEDMEAEQQQHHHQQQQQQQQHLEVDTDCVSEVAAAVVPRVLYEELVHSYRQQEEEMRRLQQELERTRRQLVQQAKKLKEYGSLLTEVKELRDFNRRLQDVLLMRLGSEPMHDNGTQTIKAEVVEPIVEAQETCREEANTSSSYSPSPRTVYTCNDGKVHLGGGIWVEEEKWHQLQRTQGDSKFTKNLAVMIWGTETLKNRSVTGVATKKKKDALPKPPLSPSKLKIVRDHLSPEREKKLVFLTARVHPGESPASFICQGVIDFLVSQHPVAQVLRDHVIFKIVPMLNPDGVYLGNYRCSLMGFDLNRHWQDPSPWAHPTLHAVKQLIVQMNQDPTVSLEFYIDVHAHSTMLNGFMYGNVFEDEERVQRQAVFPRLLCQNAPDFSFSNTSFNRDVVKAGTGRRFLGGLLDDTSYCYTLEVSFYSYMTAGSTAPVPYTEETYMKLGRNVARTYLDYYKLNNLIRDNRLTHIQSSEVMSQTVNRNGKGNVVGRDAADREKEKSPGVRQ
ncbi:BEN domain-containing protein 5-like isoform X1 [Brachyistius frenatus]|uniref:BEN domain-containing protein 5-like isoform X1 n=2 Tax=Brachyistius frenatus TaxID=100188 RepID=UPI0037E8D12C